ncbi:hypothetical protein ACQ4PT_066494 [Festuca glaucescens]
MEQNILDQILEGSMEPTYLPLETLREITDGFSTNRIIGEGGFGMVYKGIIGNRNVAVKRIRSSMTIDDKLFRREVDSLMEVKHQNVVRFLGLCSHTVETPMKIPESRGYIYVETRERLLCFEYISNGSLDKKITDELRGLEWDKRYEIIKGICAGLHYLHMEKRILHMDLKPANILLDNDMIPKITDFGLSRPTENSQTMSTINFLTPGYCAPENLFGCGRMSVKSDMYSLGAIIIEIVTGHKGIPDTDHNILRRWRHRWYKSAKETSLQYQEQVTRCIEIGSLCQKVDPCARPSIAEIMSKFVELESTDNCRTVSHESPVGQIKPPYWENDMLGVEPLELQFANAGNDKQHKLSCLVELSNDTDSFVAFKIQTTCPLPYSIEPNKDIVEPRSKCSVDITLPAANTQDHNNKQYTKGFIVQSIKVNEGLTTNDINEDMFHQHITGQHVDEIYLSVISEEPCNKEVTDYPSKRAKKQYASSAQWRHTEERPMQIKSGSVQLVIKNNTVAPLKLESYKKVMLEITGGDYSSDRPGLDLVAVVDVSGRMQGDKIQQVKTAMQFVIRKLGPMDRLSVITYSDVATVLWRLHLITDASQGKLQDLIYKLEPSGGSNIWDGLQAGLNVLVNRSVCVGRVAAIMLISGSKRTNVDGISVNVGDVPVYTFGLGAHSDHMLLSLVAATSNGGTFSHVLDKDTGGLTMVFSQCLAGLLTVAVQNLELTVAPVRGESSIVRVTAGSYPQEQVGNGPAGSVTVRFGNLYSTEVRKVIVELDLPKIQSERSAEILDVTYSHSRPAGRMKFVAPTETVTVWRTGVDFSEDENLAGLLMEEARLQAAQMIKEARFMAHRKRLDDARDKLLEAQNMLEEQSSSLLRTELQELFQLFKTQQTYETRGRLYALSSESSHHRQRFTARGGDIEIIRLFATPRMDKYMEQANKFLNEPTKPLPSVDEDVKEELGAPTVDVASREDEMSWLRLDAGIRAMKSLPWWSCRLICWLARTRRRRAFEAEGEGDGDLERVVASVEDPPEMRHRQFKEDPPEYDKEIQEGLVLIENEANIRHMAKSSRTAKTLVLFVDHTNFLRQLRKDVLVTGPALSPVMSSIKIPRETTSAEPAASSSSSIVQLVKKEVSYACDSDTDSDFVMYDSDFDVEDGDDDLFSDNIDKYVIDHNEREVCVQNEDEEALEDDDLNMEEGRRVKLMKKLSAFNPEGLINAVQKVFPDAEHRFCVRHMVQNFQRAGHRGETLKNDVWAIARSTSIPKWQRSMDKLDIDSHEAFEWIQELVPNTWIKAFFSDFPKCDMLLNNHSEVFNSYILEAREMAFLSMLETIFYKIMQRHEGKQREAEKWPGRVCPKIKKKLEKFFEWSNECTVESAGNFLYAVSSHEFEKQYNVDFKTKTCDCKRWQLTGIPCHHAIACCRKDRINPENLVHSCYTIDTFNKAYGFNLAPLRGRVFWEKMNGEPIYPPLYTKVMGRPKKNRKKAPEEKVKKGVTIITKAGTTIRSVCGKAGHNKKGHNAYVNTQVEQMKQGIIGDDEEVGIPSILEHIIPHSPNPNLDPTNVEDSMVYKMQLEERDNVPVDRFLGPLPENAFVAAARDSIPEPRARVTTASTRGSLRGRGRGKGSGRSNAPRPQSKTNSLAQGAGSRGEAKSKKRSAEASTSGTPHVGTEIPNYAQERRAIDIPDLNDYVITDLNAQEFPYSQNAPPTDDI